MELIAALAQIAEIQDQLTGPMSTAATGPCRSRRRADRARRGVAAASGLAPIRWRSSCYWIVVAAGAGFVGVSEIVYNYVVHDESLARRRTRRVVGQFLPSLLGGAIVTASFVHLSPALVPLLPGHLGDLLRPRHLRVAAVSGSRQRLGRAVSSTPPAWCCCGPRAGPNR